MLLFLLLLLVVSALVWRKQEVVLLIISVTNNLFIYLTGVPWTAPLWMDLPSLGALLMAVLEHNHSPSLGFGILISSSSNSILSILTF